MEVSDNFTHTKTIPCSIALECTKDECTKDDLTKLKFILNKSDVMESRSRERLKTKWRFYKLTNLTVFAALLRDVPMVCKDAV